MTETATPARETLPEFIKKVLFRVNKIRGRFDAPSLQDLPRGDRESERSCPLYNAFEDVLGDLSMDGNYVRVASRSQASRLSEAWGTPMVETTAYIHHDEGESTMVDLTERFREAGQVLDCWAYDSGQYVTKELVVNYLEDLPFVVALPLEMSQFIHEFDGGGWEAYDLQEEDY